MCVIVFKKRGLKVPLDTLKKMWKRNPHGAGLAYHTKRKGVHVIKGLMTVEALHAELKKLRNIECVFHLRFATHGEVCPENTHPFVVTTHNGNALVLDGYVPAVLFHNGVIPNHGHESLSDTLDFVTRTLAPVPPGTRSRVLQLVGGSKFVLLQKGKTIIVGSFVKRRGLLCSNALWDYTPVEHKPERVSRSYDKDRIGWLFPKCGEEPADPPDSYLTPCNPDEPVPTREDLENTGWLWVKAGRCDGCGDYADDRYVYKAETYESKTVKVLCAECAGCH